jgi:hypothetical protein
LFSRALSDYTFLHLMVFALQTTALSEVLTLEAIQEHSNLNDGEEQPHPAGVDNNPLQ